VVDEELDLIRRVGAGGQVAYASLLGPVLPVAMNPTYGLPQDRCAEDSV
jgi:hypothetical protein